MVRFNRRRIRTRRFTRPGQSQAPSSATSAKPLPPIEIDAAEYAVEAIQAQSAPRTSQQDSTVELNALPPSGSTEETQEAFPTAEQPPPPKRMKFTCPCGADLIATPEMYDRNTRCGLCQTVMLVNLVYDPESRTHEIVAFRMNPESGA